MRWILNPPLKRWVFLVGLHLNPPLKRWVFLVGLRPPAPETAPPDREELHQLLIQLCSSDPCVGA